MKWALLRAKFESWRSHHLSPWLSLVLHPSALLLTLQFNRQQRRSARKNQSLRAANVALVQLTVGPGGTVTLGNSVIYTNMTTGWVVVNIDTLAARVIGQFPSPGPGTTPSISATAAFTSWGRVPTPRRELKAPIEHVDHPLLGFRAFYVRLSGREWDVIGRLRAKDVRLSAINMQFGDWQPGVNEGIHWPDQPYGNGALAVQPGHHPHVVPATQCGCGFWSLHEVTLAILKVRWPSAQNMQDGDFTHIPVVGVIQGWGRTREHGDGYRFQYASVSALTMIDPAPHITAVASDFAEATVRQVCRRFDVPYLDGVSKLIAFKANEETK